MKKILLMTSLILTFAFSINSCVTINIYFPAAAVEKAADKIVEEVWGNKEVQPEKHKDKSEPQSLFYKGISLVMSALGPGEAFAQEADINITTPAIRALKDAIKKRAGSIKPYLDRGNAGISNDGLFVIRSRKGLNLKDKADLTRLINAENKDREDLYNEIARANNFPGDKISEIGRIFAKSWIKQAKKGWWVQAPDGQWSKKQ
jgi:uncharacterized protein YdbL (DUF1318 family)